MELELELSVLMVSTSCWLAPVPGPPGCRAPVSIWTAEPDPEVIVISPPDVQLKCPDWCEGVTGPGGGGREEAGAVTCWSCWARGRSALARKPPLISISVG